MAAFQDTGALDDPIGIETEALVEMVVGDDGVRHITAGGDDADAGQASAAGARQSRTFVIHATANRLGHGQETYPTSAKLWIAGLTK